ncbi:MarP family serine protease [soil metagenome]
MSALDLAIVGLALATAAWGYRRGVTTGALAVVGFGAGVVLGFWLAPRALGAVLPDPYGPMLAVPAALGCGVLSASAFGRLGFGLHRRLRGRGRLEAAGGALLAALLGVLAIWIVAGLVARVDALRGAVRGSAIADGLIAVVPPPGPLAGAEDIDERSGPPRADIKGDPQVRAAKASVVKIGVSSCGTGRLGSGWIAADGVVVTNAHVVAQSDAISLQVEGTGTRHAAEAIWYDDENDIALLRSPGVSGERPLPIDSSAPQGAPLAMLGFPDGGPYTVKRAKLGISGRIPAFRVEDDYVQRKVTRLIANARPGNSGGPLVDLDGRVVGVVFASGGYRALAVPTSIVKRALKRAERPVDTGSCGGTTRGP